MLDKLTSIHQLPKKVQKLRQQVAEQHGGDLLNCISDATISTDNKFLIQSWNNAAQSIYGWTRQEVLGKPLDDYIYTEYPHRSSDDFLKQTCREVFFQGKVINGPINVQNHQGKRTLKSYFQEASLGVLVATNGILQKVNEHLCEIVGYRRVDLLGQEAKIIYIDDQEYKRLERNKSHQISHEACATIEAQWFRHDRKIFDVFLHRSQLRLSGKSIYTGYHNILEESVDIIKRKGLRAIAVVFVVYENQVITCLNLASHKFDEIPLYSHHLLTQKQARWSIAIVRAQAERALRKSN